MNNTIRQNKKVYFIKYGESLTLESDNSSECRWHIIKPVLKGYSNYKDRRPSHSAEIEYSVQKISPHYSSKSLDINNYIDGCGTYYFACSPERAGLPDTIKSRLPLNMINNYDIWQVVVRQDDSYSGFLAELLNTPFILPPKIISGYGHQTDLRMGSDCAELAIYGKRRQGFKIPYCGPNGIIRYLERINENDLAKGSIVHFGEQVSIFWEDRGKIGKFDKEDLLLQSWETKVYFTSAEKCDFFGRPYRLYKWKKEYEN